MLGEWIGCMRQRQPSKLPDYRFLVSILNPQSKERAAQWKARLPYQQTSRFHQVPSEIQDFDGADTLQDFDSVGACRNGKYDKVSEGSRVAMSILLVLSCSFGFRRYEGRC